MSITDQTKKVFVQIPALIDSGATILCIHLDVVKKYGWDVSEAPQSMQRPVLNTDGIANNSGYITKECRMFVQHENHVEWMWLMILNIRNSRVVLRHNWLVRHNPQINWRTGEVKLNSCPEECKKWQQRI